MQCIQRPYQRDAQDALQGNEDVVKSTEGTRHTAIIKRDEHQSDERHNGNGNCKATGSRCPVMIHSYFSSAVVEPPLANRRHTLQGFRPTTSIWFAQPKNSPSASACSNCTCSRSSSASVTMPASRARRST